MSSASNAIKIMTLNLRFGLADDGPNNWEHRCQAYPSLFEKYPCDIYAFQEANDFQIAFIGDLLEDYQHVGQYPSAPERWQNNVIFFHPAWECISHEHFFLSDTPKIPSKFSQSRWPRQCTIALFERNKRRLLCVNTHFDFDADVQQRSALLIQKCLLRYGLECPALLAGDFNAPPTDNSCYNVFTGAQAPQENFYNAFDSSSWMGTHHGFNGNPSDEPIDWILYRGELAVHSAHVITQRFKGYYPSDHFPLTATFNWPQD